MLRRAGVRRPRAAPDAGRRGPLRYRAAARRRAGADARLHRRGRADPGGTGRAVARLPRREAAHRELGARAVPARRVRRGAVAAGRGGRAGHARCRRMAGGRDRRRRYRATLAGTGRRHLGTRRPALGALPARLRVRAARDRRGGRGRRRARAAGGGPVELAGRRDHGQPGGLRAPVRALAAGAGRRAGGRRPAAAGHPRRDRAGRSPQPGHRHGGAQRARRPTALFTVSGTMPGRCTRRRARSCSAACGWRWSSTPAGTR